MPSPQPPKQLYKEEYTPKWAPLTLFLIPFFYKYQVLVTNEMLEFGYNTPLFSKTVEMKEIVSAEPCEIDPWPIGLSKWGGWGIRIRRVEGKWQTGYISQGGPGVKLNLSSKGKESTYVLSCNNPETVCKFLNGNAKIF